MTGIEEFVISWLTTMAHNPLYLYMGVIFFLTTSSFGMPIPEEVVLVTGGLVASVALAQSAESGLPPTIDPIVLAITCFLAVILSDALVFGLGRRYGFSLLRKKPFSYAISDNALVHVETWTKKYGALACGVFRFTPGIRFMGHFTCGASKVSWATFFTVDGLAALLTVPTQVLLLAYYGDEILGYLKQFKIAIAILVVTMLCVWLVRKYISYRKTKYLLPDEAI